MARDDGDQALAERIEEVAGRLQREVLEKDSKPRMPPEAAGLAKQLDAMGKRARKAGLLFTAKLIEMAAFTLRHPY